MPEDTFTKKDINQIDWQEFESLVDILIENIKTYFTAHNEKTDIIAPLMRTGGIIGGILSVKLDVVITLPVQFKYSYHPTTIHQIFEVPDLLVDTGKTMNIILCEGNTSSGSIATKAAASIKEKYPQAKVYLATLTKVYGGPEKLDGIEEIFYGVMTDENFKADPETQTELNLRKGITVFPWENADEELSEINIINDRTKS